MTISTGLSAGVLDLVVDRGDMWDATLQADRDHPFFFDHPLDHVPAMLVLEGVRDLVERAAGGRDAAAVTNLELALGTFCEFSPAAQLELTRNTDEPSRFHVVLNQGGRVLGTGQARAWSLDTQVPEPAGAPASIDISAVPTEHAPADLAHRARPENVMVSAARQIGPGRYLGRLMPPAEDHYLYRLSPERITVTEVVEGARQLAAVIMHGQGIPRDHQFIVTGVTVSFDRPLSRGTDLVFASEAPPAAGSTLYSGGGTLIADGREAGRLRFAGRIVGRRIYDRLRQAALAAGERATAGEQA